MQTLKFKYKTTADVTDLIFQYQRQYSCALRFAYNRLKNDMKPLDVEHVLKTINNTDLIECFFNRCAVKEAQQIVRNTEDIVIFGGRNNFIKRCQGKISKEEFQKKRLSKLYSLGEANQKGNRKFKILQDCSGFIFQPNRNAHYLLEIDGCYRKYKNILSRLYACQEGKELPISYHIDTECIYVCFDETLLKAKEHKVIANRIMAIDLNPNYVGWSICDWRSSSDFKVVKSGVFSTKLINDKDFELKGKGFASDSKARKYLRNKREFEIYEICKNLINKAIYYKCESFCCEELNINSSDKGKGTKFNKLCNNLWNRTRMVNNLQKRCNIFGIKFQTVKANYSSFVGNFLFRDLRLPDMVLASVEIGRRGYEFKGQYIEKTKAIKKNIVVPLISDFRDRYYKSLEEFGISGEIEDLVGVYKHLKKTKRRYRLSFEETSSKFSRSFSKTSLILKTNN